MQQHVYQIPPFCAVMAFIAFDMALFCRCDGGVGRMSRYEAAACRWPPSMVDRMTSFLALASSKRVA